ncbi:hypothetical protein SNEBB_004921 [Seison nebaliae]|nr:hypothetical protein SNEBB_004921 [Seison nebaliae]
MFLKNTVGSKRTFWHWLDHIWNRVDVERIRLVGAERVCAEWLLKNGAHVKFKNWGNRITDYNGLPPGGKNTFKIEEIYAKTATINSEGFQHLIGLEYLKKFEMIACPHLNDECLFRLYPLKRSLETLRIIHATEVTDNGIIYLGELTNLKFLDLYSLPQITNEEECKTILQDKLPNCRILWQSKETDEK